MSHKQKVFGRVTDEGVIKKLDSAEKEKGELKCWQESNRPFLKGVTMNSKERVSTILEHKEPDRIPFDLGSTVVSGIHKDAYQNLLDYLGIDKRQVNICAFIQQVAAVDEEVACKLNIDTRGVFLSAAADLFYLDMQREGRYETFIDPFGVKWFKPIDKGLYYDMKGHPLSGTITLQDIKTHSWPDPSSPALIEAMKREAKRLSKETDAAIVLAAGDTGIFERAQWVRGHADFLTDLIANPSLATSLLDILTDMHIRHWDKALDAMGDLVQVIVAGDDLGMQDRPLISPELYRRHIKPRHERLFSFIKKKAPNVHIFFHCCGSIYDLIPDLIEIGVDILNPVQVSATKMDTKMLKKEFGDALTFWGGGVDTQKVLPFGTPGEVREEVKRRIDDLAPGGGFVFSAVHNIQADVPPENIMAMWETLQRYGKY
jgi:uroporphyrinogen decarboxylase